MSTWKTLVVEYLPRGERSHTAKLLKAFLAAAPDPAERLDLVNDPADPFNVRSLGGYITRNFLGQELGPREQQEIAGMDRMTAQIKRADIVVLAAPMFNFGLPAAVKAWFDAVMLKGETWDVGPEGFKGLLPGRRALILMASGNVYENTPMAGWDHAMSLAKVEFTFMGFSDIRGVRAEGMNVPGTDIDAVVARGQEQVRAIVKEWYG